MRNCKVLVRVRSYEIITKYFNDKIIEVPKLNVERYSLKKSAAPWNLFTKNGALNRYLHRNDPFPFQATTQTIQPFENVSNN